MSNQTASSSADNHTSTSLSTGAKAGIGVGVAFGALLLLLSLVWWVATTRKLRKVRGQNGNMGETSLQRIFLEPKAELSGECPPSELYGDQTLR